MRREVLDGGIERRAFRHGPGFQHAIDLQPEIVMQARGVVPLHTEVRIGSASCSCFCREAVPAFSRNGAFAAYSSRGIIPLTSFHLHHIGFVV